MTENNNLVTSTQGIIKEALHKLGFDDGMYDLIKEPIRFLQVRIPVRMDDGTVKTFTGYRAQHNDAVGPTKGGVRFHPEVDEEEVKALSMWMTLKCGIVNLPYGGGKGGIVCDPRQMSIHEVERLSRGYVRAISQFVGPNKDIPAPDVFTNSQIMAWMMDEYSALDKFNSPGFITGKPIVLGGSQGRDRSTALGVVIAIEQAAKRRGMDIKDAKIVIQGFGNAGSFLAKFLYDLGAKVVGITVSYFEWVQNNQGYYWTEEEVNDKLREKLVTAFDTIYELSQNRKIDMRLAAYIVGIKRTAEAARYRGWA